MIEMGAVPACPDCGEYHAVEMPTDWCVVLLGCVNCGKVIVTKGTDRMRFSGERR